MKMSSFIVGILFTILVTSTFLMATQSMGNQYGLEMGTIDADNYNNFAGVFNKSQEMQQNIDTIETQVTEVAVDPSIVDILGAFVSGSLEALKTAWASFTIFAGLTGAIGQILHLPTITINILMSMLIIMVIIGVFISLMVKKDV